MPALLMSNTMKPTQSAVGGLALRKMGSRVGKNLLQRQHRRAVVAATAAAPAKEFSSPIREEGAPSGLSGGADPPQPLRALPKKVEGLVDDPLLHNPLQRMERLGLGWMGVILELEGVCVDYEYGDVTQRSWQQVAQEEGKPPPPIWALRRVEGMKNEQVIQEVFCWSRNPMEVRRLSARKEDILATLLGDRKPMVPSGTPALLDMLQRSGAPVALVSSAPEHRVAAIMDAAGLSSRFEVTISGDDVQRGRPDPEGYLYAAQRMGRPPVRCVVVGSSNLSVEAAHEVGMQCVAVAGRHPVYELSAADLVVRSLGELSFMNLKKLFALEDTAMPHTEDGEFDVEVEEDEGPKSYTAVQVMDR